MEQWKRWWKIWTSVLLYAVSLILYFIDIVSDILLGKHLMRGEGRIILALMFLPVIATFLLVFFKRCCGKPYKKMRFQQDPDYKLTLLGIDWFNLDDGSIYTTIVTVVLIVFRLHIIRVYVLLIKAAITKNKILKKSLDTRMRAEMFMETCFESLPQCCVQLYLFGYHSVVSHLQISSFTLSILNLVYTFTLAHCEREAEIFHNGPKRHANIDIEPCHPHADEKEGEEDDEEKEGEDDEEEEEVEMEEEGLTKKSKRDGIVEFSKADQSLVLKILHVGDPPPKKICMAFDLVLQKKARKYNVTYATIRSKQLSVNVEKTIFFWIRVINMFVESPAFFLTAFPSISLFSSMFGKKFLLLYIPVACHFIAEYWWWRPNVYKFVMNGSFHTMFLAFKLLERMMILLMICVWFLKVVHFSEPMQPQMTAALPSLVWPDVNPFLLAISQYDKDDIHQDWAKECKERYNTNPDTPQKGFHMIMHVYNKFTGTSICAIDASTYILCVVYYMNLIGMVWEIINYIVFWTFKWISKYETWKDSHHVHGKDEHIFMSHLLAFCCDNKAKVAADFKEM